MEEIRCKVCGWQIETGDTCAQCAYVDLRDENEDRNIQDNRDGYFYCGICRGWAHISTFPHNH